MNDDELGYRFRARVMPLTAPEVRLRAVELRSRHRHMAPSIIGLTLVAVAAGAVWLGGQHRDQVAAPQSSAGSASSAAVVVRDLPHTRAAQPGTVSICNDMALSGTVHGALSDPRLAWVVSASGSRVDISWPTGYSARFAPMLEVLDPSGAVVAREGEGIILGGSFDALGSTFDVCSMPG
jgi:hypothetical protein